MTTAALLAWTSPVIDWHALAPEIVLTGVVCLLLLIDMTLLERAKPLMAGLTGIGFLAALVPVLTLAVSDHSTRSLFGGAYVVDHPALLLKALFIATGYVVTLISTNYVAEGDYWESEYYILMVSSVLGMSVMSSARDLVSIFVAFELLSIPTYLLAAWRKRDVESNEAGMKYFLFGVFATGLLLYGMSLLYGVAGSTNLARIGEVISSTKNTAAISLAMVLVLVGFAFKVSSVPFHNWAPDTYEGAPTPVTAFLAVASKGAGFVALINVIHYCFIAGGASGKAEVIRPVLFAMAALSMTVGNVIALKQTNVVRLLAYSGISHAGFILAPFVVAGDRPVESLTAIITYLVIYAAMNLGAFAGVVAIARRTGSAELDTWGGLFEYAPGLTVAMTIFLASLTGIPPMGGWYVKFMSFRAVLSAGTGWGYAIGIVMALNVAIAAAYYMRIAKVMWIDPVPHGDRTPVRVPASLRSALAITVTATLLFGILPNLVSGPATPPANAFPTASAATPGK